MKVKDVMTMHSLKFCSPKTKLRKAAKAMKKVNCGALPVVDDKKKVIGLITDRDIALVLAIKQNKSPEKLKVKNFMSPKVHTVSASDDISVALREMRTNRVGRLPVVDQNGQLKGVLSVHDLLAKSAEGKNGFRNLSARGENIFKTIKALGKYYSDSSIRTKKQILQRTV